MDPINPWLDPSEVRQLAEKLIRPAEQATAISRDTGFDTSFVGFVDSDGPAEEITVPQITAQPQIPVATYSSPPTTPAPSIPVARPIPQPVVKVAPPVAAPTTVSDSRFVNFRNWLTQHFGAKEIFILDHTGTVIFDESHHGRLHFIARDLILQAGQPNNVRVRFGPAANLELIPCENPQGMVILGALFPNTLPNEHIASIRDAISQSLSA
ncbi:MAG: hypothetical protein V4727_13585 [Verrucomicrobiota bacterium]